MSRLAYRVKQSPLPSIGRITCLGCRRGRTARAGVARGCVLGGTAAAAGRRGRSKAPGDKGRHESATQVWIGPRPGTRVATGRPWASESSESPPPGPLDRAWASRGHASGSRKRPTVTVSGAAGFRPTGPADRDWPVHEASEARPNRAGRSRRGGGRRAAGGRRRRRAAAHRVSAV